MILKQWRSFCLGADDEALFPRDAQPCGTVFAPLVFLVRRDPLQSRGLFYIHDLDELSELETVRCLTPCSPAFGELADFVRVHGAGVLNVRFQNAFAVLETWHRQKKTGLVLTLVGLGDVGGTALLALKLLGHEFSKIQIFDPNKAQCARYELFTASRGVPGLDTTVQDVRMAQYEANRTMVGAYARMARSVGFTGLFCQISDPVDHLSRSVFLQSNQNEAGEYDFSGLLPEQVQGFGLGVMAARCAYYARQLGVSEETLRVYGPHGQGLICANSCGPDYDATLSAELTEKTRTANLRVRELGFKPYLAPALSSAAVSILRLVRGQEHFGAVPLGGAYFGCRSRMTPFGVSLVREKIAPALLGELQKTHAALEAFRY